jgi:hypothetical protein
LRDVVRNSGKAFSSPKLALRIADAISAGPRDEWLTGLFQGLDEERGDVARDHGPVINDRQDDDASPPGIFDRHRRAECAHVVPGPMPAMAT